MSQKYNEDLAIIIPPNDGYLDVFKEYMRYFKKNWPDCPFELILVTQEKKYEDERVTCITTSANSEWSARLLAGVKSTKCKYILTCMEDGFISKRIDTKEILRILEFIKKHNINYYRNPKWEKKKIKNPVFDDFPNAYMIRKNEIYGVNLGYVIWDREKLIEVFGDGTRNAWQIEEHFNEIAINSGYGFYQDMVSDKRNFLNVIETVSAGKWIRSEIKRLNDLGQPVNLGEREMLPKSDAYRRKLHAIANRMIPPTKRSTVKKLFSAMGYRFVTKN